MNTTRATLAIALALSVAGATNAFAQRRGSDSGSKGTPSSSGGSRSSGSSGGSSRGGGSAGSSNSGGRSTPSRASGSSGSGSSTNRSGGSGTNNNPRNTPAERPSTSGQRSGNSSGSGSSTGSSGSSSNGGKIAGIKHRAATARATASRIGLGRGVFVGYCYGCGWGYYGGSWGYYGGGYWYPAHYPRDYDPSYDEAPAAPAVTQGYLEYPYAADEDSSGVTFVRPHTPYGKRFGAVSVSGFGDVGSQTRAGHISIEGASGIVYGQLEYGQYFEKNAGSIDRLHTARFAVGVIPRIGDHMYFTGAVGARGIILDDGSNAWGPELSLGLQVFPVKPLGATVSYRVAGLRWTEVTDSFLMSELNTTASVFVGRVELQGGWHWMKLAGSPAFGGPVAGVRIWF